MMLQIYLGDFAVITVLPLLVMLNNITEESRG